MPKIMQGAVISFKILVRYILILVLMDYTKASFYTHLFADNYMCLLGHQKDADNIPTHDFVLNQLMLQLN